MNKLLTFLVLALFAITFTSAITVDYSAYSAIIEDDGTLTTSNNQITNFDMKGYKCLDTNCINLGPEIYNQASGSNQITVDFPQDEAKYVLYFYKDGYIGWEGTIYIPTNSGNTNYESDIYLSKKANGYAPIQNFNVAHSTNVNSPILIDLEVGIDTNTYAAIVDNAQTGLDHNENVETLITLEIFDNNNNKIHEENQTLFIDYSDSQPVSFDYTFSQTGNYSINLTTNVPDAKIINALKQKAGSIIVVSSVDDNDYSYTLLNNLIMTPIQPKANETIDFSVDYYSRYIDASNNILPVGTSLDIYYFVNGTLHDSTENIPIDSNGTYDFSYNFPHIGTWKVLVEGEPNPALGTQQNGASTFLEFIITTGGDNNETNNETNGTWTYHANMENLTYNNSINPEDNLNVTFDYEFYGEDGLGNYSDINGSLFFEAFVNGTLILNESHNLPNNGTFNYIHNFTEVGSYKIDFELCPVVNGTINGTCETWSIYFNVNGDAGEEDDDDDDGRTTKKRIKKDPKILTQNSGLAIGNSTAIELGENFGKEDTPSFLWIVILLLACVLLLMAILLIKRDKEE